MNKFILIFGFLFVFFSCEKNDVSDDVNSSPNDNNSDTLTICPSDTSSNNVGCYYPISE